MTYAEQLLQNKWYSKCQEIINRDRFRCQDCGTLGFHEHGCSQMGSLSEIDTLLNDWRFKGESFFTFINDLSLRNNKDYMTVHFESLSLYNMNNLYHLIPDIDCLWAFGCTPLAVIDSCNSLPLLQTYQRVMYYQSKIVSLVRNDELSDRGWLLYWEFEDKLSNYSYCTIQRIIPNYVDEAKIYKVLVTITSGNMIISLWIDPEQFHIKSLNVHHKYYIQGNLPWEYPNGALTTLCEDCHKKRHESNIIPLLDTQQNVIKGLSHCDRCGGSGFLPQYKHYENGVCFKCGGEGVCLDY